MRDRGTAARAASRSAASCASRSSQVSQAVVACRGVVARPGMAHEGGEVDDVARPERQPPQQLRAVAQVPVGVAQAAGADHQDRGDLQPGLLQGAHERRRLVRRAGLVQVRQQRVVAGLDADRDAPEPPAGEFAPGVGRLALAREDVDEAGEPPAGEALAGGREERAQPRVGEHQRVSVSQEQRATRRGRAAEQRRDVVEVGRERLGRADLEGAVLVEAAVGAAVPAAAEAGLQHDGAVLVRGQDRDRAVGGGVAFGLRGQAVGGPRRRTGQAVGQLVRVRTGQRQVAGREGVGGGARDVDRLDEATLSLLARRGPADPHPVDRAAPDDGRGERALEGHAAVEPAARTSLEVEGDHPVEGGGQGGGDVVERDAPAGGGRGGHGPSAYRRSVADRCGATNLRRVAALGP